MVASSCALEATAAAPSPLLRADSATPENGGNFLGTGSNLLDIATDLLSRSILLLRGRTHA